MASKNIPQKSTTKSAAPQSVKTPASTNSSAPKSHASVPFGQLPSLEEVQKVPGTVLSTDELKKLQKDGALPLGINLAMHPSMHKVKSGNDEYLVIMVDAPPCGCRKVNGKKERCRQHRALRRNKKKSKKPKKNVKDDDSDRKKLGALRHAEDSEEEGDVAIDGAFTPDAICIVGPAGAAILVGIDVAENQNAAPRAPESMKDAIKGILVKGPQDCPQFIPEDKISKDEKGNPKFASYTRGTLVRNALEEHVFYSEGGPKFDEKGAPIQPQAANPNLVKEVGDKLHVAGIVDVNECGMPIFRQIDAENPAPQDKMATVGVLANVEGQIVFVQSKGQTVGSGDNAPCIAATKDGPQAPGTVLGDAVYKNGHIFVVPEGQANRAEVVGAVVQGDFNQPVLIAKKGGRLDKAGGVTYEEAKRKDMKEQNWKALAAAQQEQLKAAAAGIENSNIAVAAAMSGKTLDQIRKEMADAKAAGAGAAEVISQSFAGAYGGEYCARSVFAYKGAGAGGTGGGISGAGKGGAVGGGGFARSGGGPEAGSQFCGGVTGGPRSVFAGAPGVGGPIVMQQQSPSPSKAGANSGGASGPGSVFLGAGKGPGASVYLR